VASCAEDSVTVLAITPRALGCRHAVDTQPAASGAVPPPALRVAVAITPDGKHVLLVKGRRQPGEMTRHRWPDGQLRQVDGKNYDMATRLNPLNV